MLEVVEHEQQPTVSQMIEELSQGRHAAAGGQVEGLEDGRRHELGRGDRSQRHEGDASGEAVGGRCCGGLEGQGCLADAARAQEGEQAAGGVGQARRDEG